MVFFVLVNVERVGFEVLCIHWLYAQLVFDLDVQRIANVVHATPSTVKFNPVACGHVSNTLYGEKVFYDLPKRLT